MFGYGKRRSGYVQHFKAYMMQNKLAYSVPTNGTGRQHYLFNQFKDAFEKYGGHVATRCSKKEQK